MSLNLEDQGAAVAERQYFGIKGRVDQLEKEMLEMSRIVKGEKEDEGLQFHVTRIRTGLSIIQLELAGVGTLILVTLAILGYVHSK